jgi:hypothetical protein
MQKLVLIGVCEASRQPPPLPLLEPPDPPLDPLVDPLPELLP